MPSETAPIQHASCPAKIMLAGEYAVVEGKPSLLVAVNRRADAFVDSSRMRPAGPFLQEVHALLSGHYGSDSEAAKAICQIEVDTSSFREGEEKLGLGSSAAAVVSAVALAMGRQEGEIFLDQVHYWAALAHGNAQARQGARGSGADIACCTYGGCIAFEPKAKTPITHTTLPDLHWRFPWTGHSASTPKLVAGVKELKKRDTEHYQSCIQEIDNARRSMQCANNPTQSLRAISQGAKAISRLGEASKQALWLPLHQELADLAQSLGGALKSSGAGGGDLAIAAFAEAEAAEAFDKELQIRGILCPDLALDNQGVRLQP